MSFNKRARSNTPNNSMENELQQESVPPVIIKFTDSKGNFKQPHSTHQFKSFTTNLISLIGGVPRKSVIARGGDLFVHPTTEAQQQKLLGLTNCGGRPIQCSLPKSCTSNKGVIEGVPIALKNEELLPLLRDQHVTEAYRFKNKQGVQSERVALSFSSLLPEEVTVAGFTYRVGTYWPTPYRCSKCQRLGHTSGNGACNEEEHCNKCCKIHTGEEECKMWCVNCNSDNHQADSRECPSFLFLRDALREKTRNGGTLKEAAASIKKVNKHPNYAAAVASGANAEPLDVSRRLKIVEEEIATLKSVTVPAVLKVAESAVKTANEAKAEVENVKSKLEGRLENFFKMQNEHRKNFEATQLAELQSFRQLLFEDAANAAKLPDGDESMELEESTLTNAAAAASTNTGQQASQKGTPPPRNQLTHPPPPPANRPHPSAVPSHVVPRRESGAGRGQPTPKPSKG